MRNDINKQPHTVLWLGLAVLLIFSFLIQCSVIDVPIGGESISVTPFQLASGFALFLGVLGLIYAAVIRSGKQLTKWMTMTHIAFSLFTAITFIYVGCDSEQAKDTVFSTGVIVFLVAQLIFIANIIYSFVKK